MESYKKNILLKLIIALFIIGSTGLLAGCALNYPKVFSIKTLLFEWGGDESTEDHGMSDEPSTEDSPVEDGLARDEDHDLKDNNDEDQNMEPEGENTGNKDEESLEDDNPKDNGVGSTESDSSEDNGVDSAEDNNFEDSEDGKHSQAKDKDEGKDGYADEDVYGDKGENLENDPESEREIALPVAKVIRNSTDKDRKRVAITFDDGPDDYFTPQILDVLKEYDTKSTFFILGSNANKNRDVLKRISDEGHVVASHSWSHANFTKISQSKAANELQKTDELIEEVVGKSHRLFRLPYGAFNQNVLKVIAKQGFHNIYWSIDPRDWSGISPKKILDNIKANVEPGSIILLHSSGSAKSIPNTVKALPSIIEFLQEQDYEIVTIPELLEDALYTAEN